MQTLKTNFWSTQSWEVRALKRNQKRLKRSVLGVPKTTLRFGDSQDSKNAEVIILTFSAYYSERDQAKLTKEKSTWGKAQEELNAEFFLWNHLGHP